MKRKKQDPIVTVAFSIESVRGNQVLDMEILDQWIKSLIYKANILLSLFST